MPAPTAPPKLDHVPTIPINSSSKIAAKTTRALAALLTAPISPDASSTPTASPAVIIESPSSSASKAITISEIVKRELTAKGKKWWSYCIIERRAATPKKQEKPKKAEAEAEAEKEDGELEEAGFGWKDDWEKSKEERKEAWMRIVVSLERVKELEGYGEQSDGDGK